MAIRTGHKTWPSVFGAFCAVVATLTCAIAGESTAAISVPPRGIEHVLYLAVRSDPASPLLARANGAPVMTKLSVKLRISAHSQETNFFGIVPATVPEFDLAKGSNDREIWRDGKCHHERGFPKITITAMDGLVTRGQEKLPLDARQRVIGLFLPRDEILPSRRMDGGTDNIGPFMASRTETKQSRLFMDLKLYILPCNITIAAERSR